MKALFSLIAFCAVSTVTLAQTNLDLERIPVAGSGATARDGGLATANSVVGPLSAGGAVNAGDTAASVSNTLVNPGAASATITHDASGGVSVATNGITPAPAVTATSLGIAQCDSSDPNGFATANAFDPNVGAAGVGLAQLEVQPDPLDPSVVSGILQGSLRVIGSATPSAGAAYFQESFATCGRFTVQFVDNNGATTTTVFDGNAPIFTTTSGAGGNYIIQTVETVPVGGNFGLGSSTNTQVASGVFGVGADSVVSTLSAGGDCTVESLPADDDPPPTSVSVGVVGGGEPEVIVVD